MHVHRWAASIWVVLLVPVRGADAQHVPAALDSIVLERGRCYGPCPTYRVSVTRSGQVHFASRNPGDTAGTAAARVAPGTVAALLREAVSAGFFSLPETIASDRTLCPDRATDHATVTTTVFGSGGATRVVDYHGCYARDGDHEPVSIVRRLRGFEDAVDRAAGSARWARPAGPKTPAPPPNEALQQSGMHGRPGAPLGPSRLGPVAHSRPAAELGR